MPTKARTFKKLMRQIRTSGYAFTEIDLARGLRFPPPGTTACGCGNTIPPHWSSCGYCDSKRLMYLMPREVERRLNADFRLSAGRAFAWWLEHIDPPPLTCDLAWGRTVDPHLLEQAVAVARHKAAAKRTARTISHADDDVVADPPLGADAGCEIHGDVYDHIRIATGLTVEQIQAVEMAHFWAGRHAHFAAYLGKSCATFRNTYRRADAKLKAQGIKLPDKGRKADIKPVQIGHEVMKDLVQKPSGRYDTRFLHRRPRGEGDGPTGAESAFARGLDSTGRTAPSREVVYPVADKPLPKLTPYERVTLRQNIIDLQQAAADATTPDERRQIRKAVRDAKDELATAGKPQIVAQAGDAIQQRMPHVRRYAKGKHPFGDSPIIGSESRFRDHVPPPPAPDFPHEVLERAGDGATLHDKLVHYRTWHEHWRTGKANQDACKRIRPFLLRLAFDRQRALKNEETPTKTAQRGHSEVSIVGTTTNAIPAGFTNSSGVASRVLVGPVDRQSPPTRRLV